MKIILILVACCIVFLGCNFFSSNKSVKDFMPGTYSTNWTGPYSETRDTLLIEPLVSEGSNAYAITRRTFINYTGAAAKQPPEYKIVHWTGNYNESTKAVVIDNNARVLYFDPGAAELKMGITVYKKL